MKIIVYLCNPFPSILIGFWEVDMIISKVIKERGYTIGQVAESIGITRGSLANMIGGNPTVDTLQKIANVIGCSRADFFADEIIKPEEITIINHQSGQSQHYKMV